MTRWVIVALRLLIGGVFLYAAYTKLKDPWLVFALSIDAYQLLPSWAVFFVARTLPWAELLLGLWLVSGIGLRYASAAGSALLAFFFAIMVRSYAKGLTIDCGCFGLGDALGPKTLIRDGLLLAAAVGLCVLAFRGKRRLVGENSSVA
ncbi:MAG: MauE/DoxX family redox-associated membrane protein [Bryobacteraceae bacterium]